MGRSKRTNKPYYRARHKTLNDLSEEDTKHNFEERFKGVGSRRQASEPVYFGVLDGRADSFKTVTQENYRNIAKDLKEDPQQGGAQKNLSSSSRSNYAGAHAQFVPNLRRGPGSAISLFALLVIGAFILTQPSVDGIGPFRERIPESYEQTYQVHDYTQLSATPIPVGQNADWAESAELNAHTFGISQDSFAPFPNSQNTVYTPDFTYLSSSHSIASSPMSLVDSPASQLFPLPPHEPDDSSQTLSFDYANAIWAGVAPATGYGY
ncbi:unnamed protein product [Cyclocybe aegerita]|uniref:Uncharacterized protein n=1 Tax=Cyclocybe aegerita TaxID=1973307 RepID=A0A8S0XDZ8_CYCAE|nr:unnamed protein product [Cyclocybe aegerita]